MGGAIDSYQAHRIAMAFEIAGTIEKKFYKNSKL